MPVFGDWSGRRFAVPRYLEFLDGLPRTPTAKVRKHELRAAGIGPHPFDREESA